MSVLVGLTPNTVDMHEDINRTTIAVTFTIKYNNYQLDLDINRGYGSVQVLHKYARGWGEGRKAECLCIYDLYSYLLKKHI